MATDASTLADLGRTDEALAIVEKAISQFPRDAVLLVVKGRVLASAGRQMEAEALFRDAIGLDDRLYVAWNELGLLYEAQDLFEKAAFCYNKSAEINPNADVYTMLANMQLVFEPAAALVSAERALSLRPDWEEAKNVLGAAMRELSQRRDGGEQE